MKTAFNRQFSAFSTSRRSVGALLAAPFSLLFSEKTTLPRSARWPKWLIAILIGYVILAVIYSVSTPIFEPPDEVTHFPVIDIIADTGKLPVQDPDTVTLWQQEGSQPPLYYLLSAPLIRLINRDDLAARQVHNPHARIGIGLATDNHVSVLHDWGTESFPWRNTALAVHIVRFFSILLGLGTVIAIYWTVRLALPGQTAIQFTAVLLAAFNPMFLFISSSVNNDNLINLLSAATIAWTLHLWRAGLTPQRILVMAILLALASISKLSGLALYPVAGLAVLLIAWRNRMPPPHLIGAAIIVSITWAVLAGWWYARNVRLYDDPTGMNRMIEIIGPRDHTVTLSELGDEFEGLRLSFWGVFGTLNVIAPDWLFDYGDALLLAPLVALLLVAVKAYQRPAKKQGAASISPGRRKFALSRENLDRIFPILLLALHALIVFVALINWTRRTPATQGRLMFPALGALATLMALGIAHLFPREIRGIATPAAAIPLVIAAVILPFHTIRPAYRLPQEVKAIPDSAIPVEAQFGPIQLLGVEIGDQAVEPGREDDGLNVTLYWRPLAHTDVDMSLYVQVFGLPHAESSSGLQEIGKIDTYPGGGLLRTTTWDLNTIYADHYRLPITADALTPVQPRLKIGWRDFVTGEEFAPQTFDGDPRDAVTVDSGRVIGADQTLQDGVGPGAVFNGALRLNRSRVDPTTAQSGASVTVALEWEASARVPEDFTILVHLIDPAGGDQPLAQGDAPPLDGRWPTSAWEPGHSFVDEHTIALPADLPPGAYWIAVGFYRPADFTRLPVETDNETLPGAILLPQTVTVDNQE
jgi:4-amino-4-deoxy-L-arabinose transferase-like glycosyltransferase